MLALSWPGWAKPVHFDITEALLKKSRDRHWVALEPVYFKLSIPDNRRDWLRVSRPFTVQQRRLLACYWYIEEIESGGHHQFFANEGILCPEVEAGFREMELTGVVQVLMDAKKILGLPEPADVHQTRKRLESLPLHAFRALDDRLSRLNSKDEVWKSLDIYVSKHRQAFRFQGTVNIP